MRTPTFAELEASVEAYFRRVVRERLGGYTMKLIPAEKGAPDRLVILPGGRLLLVELKVAKGGQVAPAQRYWHERAESLGFTVPVICGRQGVDEWASSLASGDPDKPQKSASETASRRRG